MGSGTASTGVGAAAEGAGVRDGDRLPTARRGPPGVWWFENQGSGSEGLGLLMAKQTLAQLLAVPPWDLQQPTHCPWFDS